jgi:hypothetical protein
MDHQVLSLPAYMASKAISVTINQVLHLKLLYMEGAILAKVLFGGNKMSGSHCSRLVGVVNCTGWGSKFCWLA